MQQYVINGFYDGFMELEILLRRIIDDKFTTSAGNN